MVHFDGLSLNYLGPVGCLYDMVGALLLARALAFVRPRDMERQSTSGYGGFSSPLLRMFSEQKVDAWFGLSFFFVGFAFQASSGLGYKTSDFGLVNAATVALVAVLALYHFVRETLTRYLFRNSLKTPRHPANPTKPRLDENTIEELWNGTV